jgi:phosphate uptake regulator
MKRSEDTAQDSQERLEAVIKRMQKLQRSIKASGQPASMRELAELKDLGREYARIIDRIANSQDGSELA